MLTPYELNLGGGNVAYMEPDRYETDRLAPTTLDDAVAMARQLMQDGPRFQRGYTLENAALAVADVFGFDRAAIEAALRPEGR